MQYGVGDLVRCIWGAKPVEYEAKILDVDNESQEYYVHYQGWNKRYDEWITEDSIIGLSKKHAETPPTTETPKVRHSKREKKVKKPVDWSPAHNPPARSEEKPMRKKVPHASTKSKHSPVSKIAKHSAASVSPVLDDSSDDGLSSDEETVDLSIPRSYIDVLAKEKKKAERRQEQGRTPQFSSSARSCKVPQTKVVSNGAQAITRLALITTIRVFASISTKHDHLSTRRPELCLLIVVPCIGTSREGPRKFMVVNEKILAQVKSVAAPSACFLSENHSALNLMTERAPPEAGAELHCLGSLSTWVFWNMDGILNTQLGTTYGVINRSPYKYNDEYHTGLISSSMDYDPSLVPCSSRPLHGEESDSRTFSSSSSEPDDMSATIVPIITSEAVSTVTIVT
ncbi:hypothetical protein ANCDUO_04274 [Ancylostoma duodenale]|uniref:Chromo domain-containing protein n=1 Tax=Ancylostoma duodenale TaxID=51022 RepID=A0A0C2H1K0_9BILA|nr:hypothetical protein ANCDUO_04274 [Ancylostoma duodenale]